MDDEIRSGSRVPEWFGAETRKGTIGMEVCASPASVPRTVRPLALAC
jgi:hypothetical protein